MEPPLRLWSVESKEPAMGKLLANRFLEVEYADLVKTFVLRQFLDQFSASLGTAVVHRKQLPGQIRRGGCQPIELPHLVPQEIFARLMFVGSKKTVMLLVDGKYHAQFGGPLQVSHEVTRLG